MANTVPNIPFKTKVTDDDGYLSQAWVGVMRQIFERIGGSVAQTNTELASTVSGGISTQIAALQAAVTLLQTETSQLSDFSLEPTP